jgi:hypothetical protein
MAEVTAVAVAAPKVVTAARADIVVITEMAVVEPAAALLPYLPTAPRLSP